MTNTRAYRIISVMSAVKFTANIVFYTVAAAIALLFAVVFSVSLFRKKRKRNAFDVIVIIVGTLVLLGSLAACAFAVINAYAPFGLSASGESGGKLEILYNGNALFAVPYIGGAAGLFAELGLISVVAPAAIFLMCLISLITLGAKTYRLKKIKDKIADNIELPLKADEPTNSDSAQEEIKADIEQTAEESPLELAVREEELLPEPEQSEIEPRAVRNIFDEIDKLVTGSEGGSESRRIDDQLKKAIEEGYALRDALENAAEEEPLEEEEEPETEEEPEEEEPPAIHKKPEEEEEHEEITEEPLPEIVPESGRVTARRRIAANTVIAVDEPEAISEDTERHFAHSSQELPAARVRTIIRRTDKKEEQKKAPDKTVEAQSGGLPLTRKYIILNRRNAAAVFNDYLNSKRESEKAELKDSLNTIIMK